MSTGPPSIGRNPRLPAFGLATVLLLSACAGGTGTTATSGTTTPPESSPSPAGTPQTVAVNATVWFAGFKVTLGSATFDPAQSLVSIDARFENLGNDPATFDGTLSLAAGGSFFEPDTFIQEIPNVPGLATGAGTLAFTADASFRFDDAVLTIGRGGNNQAVVPLGGTGTVVALEPRTFDLSGTSESGNLEIELKGGEVRADVPDRHQQIEAGHLALTLEFDITNNSSFAGGYAFSFGNNLALELPDGTTVAADDGPIELLKPLTTLPGQFVRFTVNDPPEGTYALVLREDIDEIRSEVEFQLA